MTTGMDRGQPSGRLELTWTNKHRRLLSHPDGSYEWTDPGDYRVAEIRLLHNAATYGATETDSRRVRDNLLIQGDALHALSSLTSLPEFRAEYLGKVKVAYIDPPFNTGQAFEHYDDALEHSVWLTMIRDRLLQIRDLLHPRGTLWLHLDSFEVHRARCVLDEVFGVANYLGTVVWQRTSAKSLARRTMGTLHESILVYGASEQAELKQLFTPMSDDYVARRFTNADARGRYDTGDLTASSYRPHLDSGKPWRGFDPSSIRRCWAVPRAPLLAAGLSDAELANMTMREKLDALDAAGYIHWSESGMPRFKKYLDNVKGRLIGDLWTDINVINSQAGERTGFSTQKPEGLIRRVLQMATDTGDVVLDCFLGSGTTAAVAQKMGRRWVGVEWSSANLQQFVVPRLSRVISGEDADGISKDESWKGGGGFRALEVAPSMFDVSDGRVVLADWAVGGILAEAVAAQAGFEYRDEPPFSGRKGRQRLAVVDGLVNETVIRLLLPWLADEELLTVYGTAVDPDSRAVLSELRRGSTVRKMPESVLDDYRRKQQKRDLALEWPPSAVDDPATIGTR